jgi:hypothetical protein
VSPYLFLALAAVFLFLIVLVIVGMLIQGAIESLVKGYHAHRRYDLIERGLDRDLTAGIKEIAEAIKEIDGDLPWTRHRNANDHNHRPLVLIDDNGFPSSDAMPQSLPARREPDS